MRVRTWLHIGIAAIFVLGCGSAVAQDDDHGHGHAYGHDKPEFREVHESDHFYRDRDREYMHHWYEEHHDHLPRGLAKRDHLSPEMERELVVRGTLPVELRHRMYPCPEDLERQLPPPPPQCAHVLIGGHVVLLNRANFQIVDVFHFEL